jgi:hypothetical protein
MQDLSAACGVTRVYRVLQVEVLDHRRQVVGVMIHVMSVARVGGPTVTATVMRDHSVAMAEEEQHPCIPVIG